MIPCKYFRGSEWRKWDLHAHTPLDSNWYNRPQLNTAQEKKDFAKKYIEFAKAKNLALIAITDHNFCDTFDDLLIPYIQEEAAKENITILPGFEITSKDGSGIHLLAIFPEYVELDKIKGLVDQLFPPNTKKILSNGSIVVSNKDLKEIKDKIDEANLEAIFIFAHANSNNGILEKETINGQRRIQEWKNEFINICQLSKDPLEFKAGSFLEQVTTGVLPNYKREMTYILASDCRSINDKSNPESVKFLGEKFTWIKADPTFEGLKQIIREPNRVYIGDRPNKLLIVENNKTKYIKEIVVNKTQDSKTEEAWFNCRLELNSGLISIIGNKGSGKSALAEIIGLFGSSSNYDQFSFLTDKRFKKKQLAKNFEGKIVWEDNQALCANLNDTSAPWDNERVKCIPQSYIENLCNEMDDKFQKEINGVIFSHIANNDKLGKTTLEELIVFKTQMIDKKIKTKDIELSIVNKELVSLEKKNTFEYKSTLEERVKLLQDELRAHYETKPKKIEKPELDAIQIDINKELNIMLVKELKEIERVEAEIKILEGKERDLNKRAETLKLIKSEIEAYVNQYAFLKENYAKELLLLADINFDDIVQFKYNGKPINDKLKALNDSKKGLEKQLKKDPQEWGGESLYYKLFELKKNRESIQNRLDEPSKKYQKFLSSLKDWKVVYLKNNKEKKDLKSEIRYLADLLPEEINKVKGKVRNIVLEKLKMLDEKIKTYGDLYKPIIKFIEREKVKWKGDEFLNFTIDKVVSLDFKDKFFGFIDRGKIGSFQGVEESDKFISAIIRKYDFSNNDEVIKFLEELISNLEKETLDGKVEKRDVERQLTKGKSKLELYDFIYGLDFINIDYQLRLGDKPLDSLSPGERGALLLIFYLLIDRDDIPLIIDQPEENLDNESVFLMLVPYIKEAKERRQIILVTHNPNLAVVCDAEQIIYCMLDKKDKNKASYITGSIENPLIRKKIIDVLEGTKPAFMNRQKTYAFKSI